MTARELINHIEQGKIVYNQEVQRLAMLESEVTKLKERIDSQAVYKDKLENLVFACKLILEKLTYESKHKIEEFLTLALRNIFVDREYSIKLDINEEAKRPSLNIILIENGIEQDIKDAVGGGILSTLGLLLQIYYLEVYGLERIMFIDEGLKEVSKDLDTGKSYLHNILQFLKYLADSKDYTFVIVTHDSTVSELADKTYEVIKGEVI